MPKTDPIHYERMELALELAGKAREQGETPVGALIYMDGAIIGHGYNQVEKLQDPTAHAEMIAIREACKALDQWRLNRAVMYVTLEPCVMCAAAILHCRMGRVFYGAPDIRWGAFGALFDLSNDPRINHAVEVIAGIKEKEATDLLTDFFRGLRA